MGFEHELGKSIEIKAKGLISSFENLEDLCEIDHLGNCKLSLVVCGLKD